MPNTYVSLPGFDVDDKDIETQKVQNAVARVRFINEEITSRAQMKQYNCHEGVLPFTKSYLLRPLFNAFLMSPKPFHATEACIGCKTCEKVCPVCNITVTDRPVVPFGEVTVLNVWLVTMFVRYMQWNMER